MHILELPSFFPPYGGLFCLDQSKALAARGHTVRIVANVQLGITLSRWKFLAAQTGVEERTMDGITVYYRQMRGWPMSPKRNMKRWVATVCGMADRYISLHGRPDVIHAHCAKWAGLAAMKIGEKWGIPYVVTEHLSSLVFAAEIKGNPEDAWQVKLLKRVYKRAARVVPVAAELVDNIAPYFGKDYQWTEVPNTIDTDFFRFSPRKPLEGRTFTFCCLAMFIPLKGYDVLLEAFSRYLNESGNDARLIVAGTYTDSPRLANMVENFGLKHKVDIRGLVDKQGVRSILYESDCLVLASRSEAQPLVLIEAMSTGIPVVATEIIPQSMRLEGCHIVPVDDAEAMAHEMKAVRDNYAQVRGEALSRNISLRFSPEVVGEKLTEVFTMVKTSQVCH